MTKDVIDLMAAKVLFKAEWVRHDCPRGARRAYRRERSRFPPAATAATDCHTARA